MQTLADFKRALTPGSKWRGTYHLGIKGHTPEGVQIWGDSDMGIRTVTRVTPSMALVDPGNGQESRLVFGAASDWEFNGDSATNYEVWPDQWTPTGREDKRVKVVTYTRVTE